MGDRIKPDLYDPLKRQKQRADHNRSNLEEELEGEGGGAVISPRSYERD